MNKNQSVTSSRVSNAILGCAASLLLGSALTGCNQTGQPQLMHSAAGSGPAATAAAQAKESYAALLDDLDLRIQSLAQRAEQRDDDWLSRERLAGLQLQRAGLTGSLADYAQVEQVLNEALAIAPEGSGPLLLAARFNYSLHRLDKAESLLDKLGQRAIAKADDQLASRLLRAQIAGQRGNYAGALSGLREVAAVNPAAAQAELALLQARTGGLLEAEALLRDALATAPASDQQGRAWLRLQLAILDLQRGRYDAMLAGLKQADAELPGWWLVREHMAEAYTLLGQDELAKPIYEEVISQTGHPQFIEALAAIHQRAGHAADAQQLIAEAGGVWDKQLKLYPEAAGGHALEYYLEHGSGEQALELARANFQLRPGGEASLLLAQAQLQAGRPEEACRLLEQTLASGYRSAELHGIASEVYAELQDEAASAEQRRLCLQINPNYFGSGTTQAPSWLAQGE